MATFLESYQRRVNARYRGMANADDEQRRQVERAEIERIRKEEDKLAIHSGWVERMFHVAHVCTGCDHPFGPYRVQAGSYGRSYWCGDCYTHGVKAGHTIAPLDQRIAEAQPKPEPERSGAWMTPTWDGEW